MIWIITITFALAMILLAAFSWLAIKHAARFRYLSTRTVYLTIFYAGTTSVLSLLSVGVFIATIMALS
ncbi:hypothetical protein KKC94_04945 [Patescibacteria group bacterium]|nr:hypothetical protein [Patescibacteria group bacterium]